MVVPKAYSIFEPHAIVEVGHQYVAMKKCVHERPQFKSSALAYTPTQSSNLETISSASIDVRRLCSEFADVVHPDHLGHEVELSVRARSCVSLQLCACPGRPAGVDSNLAWRLVGVSGIGVVWTQPVQSVHIT